MLKNTNSRRSDLNPFNIPPVITLCVLICILAFIIPKYFLSNETLWLFFSEFSFIPLKLTVTRSVMSILSTVTCSFLHANYYHIINNMIWLVIFGSPLANRLNPWRFVTFWIFMAFVASMTFYIFNPLSTSTLVGASGAISGMIGGAARYGFRRVDNVGYRNRSEFIGPILSVTNALRMRIVYEFIGFWLVVNVLLAVLQESNHIAWQAHIGGLVAGFFCVGFFDKRRNLVA